MSTSYQSLAPISSSSEPVTALSFDPVSDVLWAGSNGGQVIAHCGIQGLRGVSYRAGDLAVHKLVAGENSVRASCVAATGIGSWAKGGMNKWFYHASEPLTTFCSSVNSSHSIAAASASSEIILLNGMTGSVLRQAPTPSIVTHLEFSHTLLLSGASDGYVRLHDPRTAMSRSGGAENAVKAHTSGLQGLQTTGNFVFTIGVSLRQGRPFPDPLVKLYDLRTMRPLPPVPFSASPAFINVMPKRTSSIAIISNQGLINIADATNPSAPSEFYQLDLTSYLTSVAISPTGAYLACGDAEGVIHIKSQVADTDASGSVPFNGFDGRPIEWAGAPSRLPDIDWDDTTPLNSIGLPYYKSLLLSSWSSQFEPPTPYFPPAQKIPVQVLNTMKFNDNVAYAALPKELKGRRNMVSVVAKKKGGRFRSGKPGKHDAEPDTPTAEYNSEDVPKMYKRVEIEYSKFGVEDFDFAFFNQTKYSGLETHILNSYTNPILQVMHFSTPIRRLAKSHITTNCPREHCLLCELGFVVRMLEDANGKNCQSSNFCKTVGVLAHASNAIDLIDYGQESAEVEYGHMIQLFHRFLVDHLSTEGNSTVNPVIVLQPNRHTSPGVPAFSPITQLLGIDAKNVITCMSCKAVREKDNLTHIVDLVYPRKAPSIDIAPVHDFVSILRGSLLRHMSHKATCQSCRQFGNFSSRRSILTKDLPPILAINAGVFNEESMKFWIDTRGETFLKPTIELQGQLGGADDPEIAVYQLRAVIVQVLEKEGQSHLVAIVRVPESESEGGSPWYLFNDFFVRNVPESEALSIPNRWKIPAVLHYERVDSRMDFQGLPDGIDASILCQDTSISLNRNPSLIKHENLTFDELPTPGTIVAIDAEFVSMQQERLQEESEYRSDGSHKVLRPARLSLARVSVLRASGPKQGVPFIDDHIHTSEVIVDYLTEFSGIKFGDLDPMRSPHTLTPLKVVYKKLRLLVDRGCVFIGHGLSKDFRIINIFVPEHQIVDTVDVYYKAHRHRRLSLRFLSWFVLEEQIQTGMHDSIEDAHSALRLFQKFLEYEGQGIFDAKLEELYKEGRRYNFKPPPTETDSPALAAADSSISGLESRLAQMYPSSQPGTPGGQLSGHPSTMSITREETARRPRPAQR